jgi:hypothetical protein
MSNQMTSPVPSDENIASNPQPSSIGWRMRRQPLMTKDLFHSNPSRATRITTRRATHTTTLEEKVHTTNNSR